MNVTSLQLNTDYALVKELTLVDDSEKSDGKVTSACGIINQDNVPGKDDCPDSEFSFWGRWYAKNGPALVRDFTKVFDKMLKSTTEGKILSDAVGSSYLEGFS